MECESVWAAVTDMPSPFTFYLNFNADFFFLVYFPVMLRLLDVRQNRIGERTDCYIKVHN